MPTDAERSERRAAPDEQRRLRWLAEDLATCLAGLAAIAARLSEIPGGPGPTRIEVQTPRPDGWGQMDELPAEPDPPIASVAWIWDDGRRVEYDWQAEVCRRSGP